MPTPKPNESESNFVARCVVDPEAVKDFPDNEQRIAFCYSQYERAQTKKYLVKNYKRNWQRDFEKQLDIAERKESAKVRRYYKQQYNKGIEIFLNEGPNNFQTLFKNTDLLEIYKSLYTNIGMRFAKWYAKNFQKYIPKSFDTSQFDDLWFSKQLQLGNAIGAERVTLVAGTAKKTLIDITQRFMKTPEFQTLGAVERGRILRNQFNQYSQYQAERVVRTEATAAANFATMQAAQSIFPGNQLMKEWSAAFDDRVRDTHSEANGQQVMNDKPFIVGGQQMMFPGDPAGGAAEVINCRCSVIHIPVEGAQTIGEITDINFGLSGGGQTGFGLGRFANTIGSTIVSGAQNVAQRTAAAFKNVSEFKKGLTDLFSRFGIDLNTITASRKLTIQQYNLIFDELEKLFSKYNFGSLENQTSIKMMFKSGSRTYGYVSRYKVSGKLAKINLGDFIDDVASRTRILEDKLTRRWFSAIDADKMLLATPVHEMTHVLLHSSMKGKRELLDKIREVRRQYYNEIRALRDAGNIKKYNEIYIGRYALHSLDEFIAESFTEYTLNSNPSKYARMIGELIDEYLSN